MFIAHDLSVVRHVSDRIAVMYLGKLMEVSPAEELYSKPIHPYTEALLAAIPIPDPRENRGRRARASSAASRPTRSNPPSGCRFHTRCPRATEICTRGRAAAGRVRRRPSAACHHPLSVSPTEIAAATRSPLSPLSAGPLMPSGRQEAAPAGTPLPGAPRGDRRA